MNDFPFNPGDLIFLNALYKNGYWHWGCHSDNNKIKIVASQEQDLALVLSVERNNSNYIRITALTRSMIVVSSAFHDEWMSHWKHV